MVKNHKEMPMFTVYYSNQLQVHKELLVKLLEVAPNENLFESEIILVQSTGMSQWLQMEIAQQQGVSANFDFLFPTRFLWNLYRTLLPNLPKENIFSQELVVWQLMQIIPDFLENPSFSSLKHYLGKNADQNKLYQLAKKIASLFDQYLVYRPNWLIYWENNQNELVLKDIFQNKSQLSDHFKTQIEIETQWQSTLWNTLVEKLRKESDETVFQISHRAYFQQFFFEKLKNLTPQEKQKLPKRVFIFGISSLPISQLEILGKLSEFCDIHLFFLNPCQHYWGNSLDQKMLDKLSLHSQNKLMEEEKEANSLLLNWGKQGRDFLNTLIEFQNNENSVYINNEKKHLLARVQQSILDFNDNICTEFDKDDRSIQIHSCHSLLREVEVLYDQLLHIFDADPALCPKDIIVMSPNIDLYAPYIKAVFERKSSHPLPYSLSDQRVQEIDLIINSFIHLLSMKESKFSVEEVMSLLEVKAIQDKFEFNLSQLELLRGWIEKVGIRSGLALEKDQWKNYNSWENGLDRLLLGGSLKEENGIWEDCIGFDESYGLDAQISGQLSHFIYKIMAWIEFLQDAHTIEDWQKTLIQLVDDFYIENETTTYSLLQLHHSLEKIVENVQKGQFKAQIDSEIIISLFSDELENNKSHLNFLAGKINFATLLPMRAIPFKVVCLLGMNEKDFPRQYNVNSFDLMQYAPQKGDRAKRDDDRYLFLEALLSAQDVFYISYIGQSLTRNQIELPSVLVSQFCDYISKNNEVDFFEERVIKHSMMAFSPSNFIPNNPNQSYAKFWLDILENKAISNHFLTRLNQDVEITAIELDELIKFIQYPAKYFFNYHLGVNLSTYDNSIEESEAFILSGLDKYSLNDQLLKTAKEEFPLFFDKEKYKGRLPVNAFKDITQEMVITTLDELHSEVFPYRNYLSEKRILEYKTQNITLLGNINYYPDQKKVLLYRSGKLRDKDIIQMWLYYLMLQINYPQTAFSFYFLKDKETKGSLLTFKEIAQEDAKLLLDLYVKDYLDSFNELQWGIYSKKGFVSIEKAQKDEISDVIQKQLDILRNDKYQEPIYLNRILNQSSGINYEKIYQKTLDWFVLMNKSIIIS